MNIVIVICHPKNNKGSTYYLLLCMQNLALALYVILTITVNKYAPFDVFLQM